MGRGVVSGILWGIVLGGFAYAVSITLVDRQDLSLPQPVATATPVPDATEFAELREESDPVAPQPEMPAGPEATASPDHPQIDRELQPELEINAPATPVSVAQDPDVLNAPEPSQAPDVANKDDIVLAGRSDLQVPAQPASDAPLGGGFTAPNPPPAPEVVQEEEPVRVEPEVQEPPVVAAVPEAEEETPAVVEEETPPVVAEVSPEPVIPPEVEPEVQDLPLAQETPETDTQMPGQRIAGLPGTARVVPRGDAAPAPAPEANGTGALNQYKVEFTPQGDAPILSIVLLIPNSGSGVETETLSSMPFPVSYALHGASPGAGELADALRASGSEILLVPSLPSGASPSDATQSLEANLALLPEAVAFIDAPEDSFQSDRNAMGAIVATASQTGHGLITFSKGLNTAQKMASRDGVPAALVFRDLDGQGQSKADIHRQLDQAAFRARQEGSVILVARARGETVEALTEWALGSRAATISLAPVSAALPAL